ncbi:tetratricopeptide repeat protein, partial [Campylobacter fetus subsp. venerealis]
LLNLGVATGDYEMKMKAFNNLGDIYRMQGRFSLSLETYNRAQELLKELPPGHEVYVMMGFASTYKDLGDYEAADNYL